MNIYSQIISKIIQEQQSIIGPIALEQARKVTGLRVESVDDITITGDEKQVLSNLVTEYEKLFGRASIEVCRDAVKEVKPPIPNDELPQILR